MHDGDLTRLLEARHQARLKWETPEVGLTADGNKVPCWVQHSATVHDFTNLYRRMFYGATDIEILADLIAVHGAVEE